MLVSPALCRVWRWPHATECQARPGGNVPPALPRRVRPQVGAGLPHYLAIVAELGARSVLDVGCGTGNWACMLAERGFEVVGLDPAAASLDVARAKPGAQRVQWIHGDVTSLPALAVDLATVTGNVSNVFLTQQAGKYAAAVMSQIPRRNGRTIAAQAGDRTPDKTQRLLGRAVWDTFAAMGMVRRFAVAGLDEAAAKAGRRRGLAVGQPSSG